MNATEELARFHYPKIAALVEDRGPPVGATVVSGSLKAEDDRKLIVSSSEFVADFDPPDYLVDGLLQRRFVYSMTAPTGGGKTAVALLLAASVALGMPIGDHDIEQGQVLYFAGENPDDIRMRWIAMADHMQFDIDKIDVHFIAGAFSIPELIKRIEQEVAALGGVDLVIVDTSAAYFDGDDENHNVQMGKHARMLRKLTTLPGKPCVLVACHPTKNASNDSLLPRGGGAFIAEMDGNLVCLKRDNIVDLAWQGKFRGPDFEPVGFQLLTVNSETLKDSKGRMIPTVMAKPLTERVRSDIQAAARRADDDVLCFLKEAPDASIAGMAEALGWFTGNRNPHKSKVYRALQNLKGEKFVTRERGHWKLTEKGRKEASQMSVPNCRSKAGTLGAEN